jgi:hypothetical protein
MPPVAERRDDRPPIDERQRRTQQPDRHGRGEAKATAAEQRQHDERDRGYGEPRRRTRLWHRVAPEGDLECTVDRCESDQHVEPVPARTARAVSQV